MSTRLGEPRVEVWDATEWPSYDGAGQALPTAEMYRDFLQGVRSAKKLIFGNLALQVFVTQSGGVLSERDHPDEVMEKRVEEASAFYTLTFDPARTNEVDEYRDLKLEVDKPGLTAQTRALDTTTSRSSTISLIPRPRESPRTSWSMCSRRCTVARMGTWHGNSRIWS